MSTPIYEPTPEEIKRLCAKIREGWAKGIGKSLKGTPGTERQPGIRQCKVGKVE